MADDELKLYYSIGEVAERLGVNTSLIRFWENSFPHIKAGKNSRGERRFTKDNIRQLEQVYHLVRERGFTLEGARKEITRQKSGGAKTAGNEDDGRREAIRRLRAVRAKLVALRDKD